MRYCHGLVISVGLLLLCGCPDNSDVGGDAGVDSGVDLAALDAARDGPIVDGSQVDATQPDALRQDATGPDAAAADMPGPDTVSPPDLAVVDLPPPSPDIDPYKSSFNQYCSNYSSGWGTCIGRANMMCNNTCYAHPAAGIKVPSVECGLSRSTPGQIWCLCCLAGPVGRECKYVYYSASGVTCADCQTAFNDNYCGVNP